MVFQERHESIHGAPGSHHWLPSSCSKYRNSAKTPHLWCFVNIPLNSYYSVGKTFNRPGKQGSAQETLTDILEGIFDFGVDHVVFVILTECTFIAIKEIQTSDDLKTINPIVADFRSYQGAIIIHADIGK